MTELPTSASADRRWMARCLHLARRSLGHSWPNPAVGCILVRNGELLASGRTAPGGRPHAEVDALERVDRKAPGATAYISLEPCAHHGETPPCADALAEAGIARCVVSLLDPDPRVSGRGVEMLRSRGIRVETGLLADAAQELLAGHATRVRRRRPWLTLKIAATLDGAVGGAGRQRARITGDRSRAFVESLRSEHDAVLTGIGTALADNPLLIPQNRGLARRAPVRTVLDSRLRLPVDSRLVRTSGEVPLWVVHGSDAPPENRRALEARGVNLLESTTQGEGRLDLGPAIARLAERGMTRVLAETGPILSAALLTEGLADEVIWLAAGRLLGQSGLAAIESAFDSRLSLLHCLRVGDDTATFWRPAGRPAVRRNSGATRERSHEHESPTERS